MDPLRHLIIAGLSFLGLLSCRLEPPAPGSLAPRPACGLAVAYVAAADTWVDAASPSASHGGDAELKTDKDQLAYLRFEVICPAAPVVATRLRINVTNDSAGGPGIFSTDSSWDEASLTWGDRPAPSGSKLGELGDVAEGVKEVSLGLAVTADGTYSFVLTPVSSDGMDFSSSESSSPPTLLLDAPCPVDGAP